MATSLKLSIDINSDIDTVFEALCSEEFINKKLEELGARSIRVVSSGNDGDSAELVYTREEPAEAPSALKKFISEWNEATNRDRWSGVAGESYDCTYQVELKGPVKISGTHTLEVIGSGTRSTITMDISSGIPLVGKKLEKFVAGQSEEKLQKDLDFQKQYLE